MKNIIVWVLLVMACCVSSGLASDVTGVFYVEGCSIVMTADAKPDPNTLGMVEILESVNNETGTALLICGNHAFGFKYQYSRPFCTIIDPVSKAVFPFAVYGGALFYLDPQGVMLSR